MQYDEILHKDGNCVIRTMRTMGYILILGVVALNIVYLILAETDEQI